MYTSVIDEIMILAVHSGARWLDTNHPGWVTKIDLSNLDMNNCRNCVIGQAVGDYCDTIRMASGIIDSDYYNLEYEWSIENGFSAPQFNSDAEDYAYYKGLEVLWTAEVKKRLS